MAADKKGKLIVLSGPSGTGKGTIVRELEKRRPVDVSISCTTRAPRQGEIDGRDYYFVSEADFAKRAAQGDFLEQATVFGKHYGTPRQVVMDKLEQGRDVLLEIDVQGARQVKENYPPAELIFVLPPTREALLERLRHRGTETEEQIQARYGRAEEEMKSAVFYDHQIVNGDLATAVSEIEKIMDD